MSVLFKYSIEIAVKGDRSDKTGQKLGCVNVSISNTCTTDFRLPDTVVEVPVAARWAAGRS
jgi:hypothetical protein